MYQAYQAVVAIKHSKLLSDTSLPYKKNARLYHPFELKEFPLYNLSKFFLESLSGKFEYLIPEILLLNFLPM